ncbi:hypothetical protein [Streptomyces fimicarius]|uniref:hypothetical protein n=1 Tax=Streptomyces TaxID=1883 RepID=UPI00368650D0
MASNRMNFILDGRDLLSRVLDRAGDNADRLGRRLLAASINGDAAMRRLGNTTATRMAALQRDTDIGDKALQALKGTLISLAPAAIPAAASLAPIAAGAGAVAVASMAFTAALIPQISALSEASEAEKKYEDAVAKSGRTSQEAVTAQLEYQRTMADLPPETRKAAAALGVLKDSYKDWSDALADDTMPAFTKGLAITNTLLPKTEGLVKGTSRELDRMMTIVAGGMESPGLDRLNTKFTDFANNTLRRVNDQLVHLMRTADTGKIGGGLAEFMDFARAQGPVVADTLRNIGTALVNVLRAGSDVGVGMLDLVNALTGIVAAVPPGAIAAVLQLALAIKAVKLAAVGMAAARAAMAAFGTQLVAMQVAAAAAPGRLAAVTAAIGAMSRGAKLAMAGTGIGLLVIALTELSANSKKAPPDVDKLTTSLKIFAETGEVSGEAARAFGKDLSGLGDSLQKVTDPKGLDKFQQSIISFFGTDSTPIKDAKENLDGFDKSLASLVSNGNAKLAAAALQDTIEKLESQGKNTDKLRSQLDDYNDALAGQAFEQRLAAESMGLFGAQAQQVQAKLDAQKASTDGLRQSIMALNEVNRAALDGRAGMEAAIDAVAKVTKDHADALHISNGELNLNSEKARTAQAALTDLARKTEENVSSARNSGKSWEYAKGQYDRGRTALINAADAMGLNRDEARRLADQILKTPNKTAYLKGDLKDLQAKLEAAKSKLGKVPDSRKAAIRAEIADLKQKIADAEERLNNFNGKSATAYIDVQTRYANPTPGPYAGKYVFANGGLVGGYASGGMVGFPGGGPVRGPGTGTSDSILARVSNGEFVIKAASVAKYGLKFLDDVNAGRLAPGRAAVVAAPASRPAEQAVQPVTYNVYPRASVIDVQDLRLIQRQEEARQRVGRPR